MQLGLSTHWLSFNTSVIFSFEFVKALANQSNPTYLRASGGLLITLSQPQKLLIIPDNLFL